MKKIINILFFALLVFSAYVCQSLATHNARLEDIIQRQQNLLVHKTKELNALLQGRKKLLQVLDQRDSRIMMAAVGSPDTRYATWFPEILMIKSLMAKKDLGHPWTDALETALDVLGNKIPVGDDGRLPKVVRDMSGVLKALSNELSRRSEDEYVLAGQACSNVADLMSMRATVPDK